MGVIVKEKKKKKRGERAGGSRQTSQRSDRVKDAGGWSEGGRL
jgi:hypothetical protein